MGWEGPPEEFCHGTPPRISGEWEPHPIRTQSTGNKSSSKPRPRNLRRATGGQDDRTVHNHTGPTRDRLSAQDSKDSVSLWTAPKRITILFLRLLLSTLLYKEAELKLELFGRSAFALSPPDGALRSIEAQALELLSGGKHYARDPLRSFDRSKLEHWNLLI
ncbi:unnamed protein product [Calypogeia fissa]